LTQPQADKLASRKERDARLSAENLICVIDDDRSMSRMLARAISAAGFEVACFDTAEAFLDSGVVSESTCLILDVDLPGISGIDLLRSLNNSQPQLAVVMISGEATEETRLHAFGAGAIAFFDKPFNVEALLAAVRSELAVPLA
jgi:FixJ family two-component response regulator